MLIKIFIKRIKIFLFFLIFTLACNSVKANSIDPKLSKSKARNLTCQNYLATNNLFFCWDGVKYIKISEIKDKEENKKLAANSQDKNIQFNKISDKEENKKLLDIQKELISSEYNDTTKLIITPIIKRVQEKEPKNEPKINEPNPGMSFGIPSAMGSNWRDVFISVAYTADYETGLFTWYDKPNNKVADGSMNFGFGFGDSENYIGGEISVGIISLFSQKGESGFGADGTAGIKLHKAFPEFFNTHGAIAWSNPVKWGEASKTDTIYGVLSKEFELKPKNKNSLSTLVSVGIGTGSHRSNTTIDDRRNDPNIFGGVGIQILPRLSIASSWNGNALNAGFGISPFNFPLNFSIGISDLTNNSSQGAQFNINTGYSFSF